MKVHDNNLRDIVAAIESWDDWSRFEDEHFKEESLGRKPEEEWERRLRRDDRTIDGIVWHATSTVYADLDAFFLLNKLELLVFAKLEPEAAADNAAHPEWYGQICFHCELWTRSHEPACCPVCNGELLAFPLNEDDQEA